jgi:hypothetical protein
MAELSEIGSAGATTDVSVVTTNETVAVTSDEVFVERGGARVVILAHCILTTGAATTTVTPRIRRGTTTAGTLIGEANAITIGAVAGSNEHFNIFGVDEVAGVDSVQYSLTVQQAAASGNGTVLSSSIVVLVL